MAVCRWFHLQTSARPAQAAINSGVCAQPFGGFGQALDALTAGQGALGGCATRLGQAGRQFRQRKEHEGPLAHARVVDSEIVHQPLLRDEFVLVLYAPNFAAELANEPTLTQAQYFASQHITVSSRRLGLSIEDSLLSKAGWQRQSKIRCQHYATAFQLLKQDKLLLTLPRQLATTFLPPAQGWQILDLPIALTHIELHGYWHQQQQVDPLYGWLRQQIFSAFH